MTSARRGYFSRASVSFNLLSTSEHFSKYKLLILPDIIRVDDELKSRLERYLEDGGKILCSGELGA